MSSNGNDIKLDELEDYLPQEISWRCNKVGQTIPNLYYRIQKDIKSFRELIYECRDKLDYHYFDYNKLEKMSFQIEKRGKEKRICFGPRIFTFSMQILILQKWQREGKIDIGIKC